MRSAKRIVCALITVMLLCSMLTTVAFAADTGSVWLNVTQESDGTTALIVADTTVVDGQVEITFDAAALIYDSIQVNDAYVAMYAVNADTAGVVKIAWVAPEAYAMEEADWLIKVTFTGNADELTLSGTMYAADGAAVTQSPNLDKSALEDAIAEAEGLYENDYTSRSYATMKKALDIAKGVLADPTATQSEVDAAAETMRNGIASLQYKLVTNKNALRTAIMKAQSLKKSKYTEESYAAVENALKEAQSVLYDRDATQKEIDTATQALNDAMDALEVKKAVNTYSLKSAIRKAERLNKDSYTAESYAKVEEALEHAKAVLADSGATQEEVDEATDALNDAMDALVKTGSSNGDFLGWLRDFFKNFFRKGN